MSTPPMIPFIDLAAQRDRIRPGLDRAIAGVLDSGQYILGDANRQLEAALSARADGTTCLAVASGTDALALPLMAWGLKPGDAVFVPAFTFVATAEVVAWLGATPVFVDVLPDLYTMDPDSLVAAIEDAREKGLTPRVVMPVGLFGQPADMRRIGPIAATHDLKVIDDAAQSFGAQLDEHPVGTLADVTATSFYPAKPLGCYGDGGAVFTADAELAAVMRSLHVHGQGEHRYDNVRIGMNGRLDTIQAAILLEKLKIFDDEIVARNRLAALYDAALGGAVATPHVIGGGTSVWAQYTIQVGDRDRVAAHCRSRGVPTAVFYPIPLSHQVAYRRYPVAPGGVPVSEELSRRVISLPMHPYLSPADQDRIVAAVHEALP